MLHVLLLPFSVLFGVITFVRNKLYDWSVFPSVYYDDVFVISVGNITVGGTGKTPYIEYLLRLLSQVHRVAVVSRGYKRKTKGFRFVESVDIPADTGDEPYQIKRKFPNVVVAVDADRVRAIAHIRKIRPDIKIILLDDAFQYRRIRPNLSILLADYNRPMYSDRLLPAGRLREYNCFAKRADIMVVTKSPPNISIEKRQEITQLYKRVFSNELYFTSVSYGELQPLFPATKHLLTKTLKHYNVLLVTGIAYPKPFEDYINAIAASVQTINFSDHHNFSEKDILLMFEKWDSIKSSKKVLITTEKDAVRLHQAYILQDFAYYIPVETTPHPLCLNSFIIGFT